MARLCLLHGCASYINREDTFGRTPHDLACATMKAWLARIHVTGGWARHLSEPRYALVVLRDLTANGRARRERAFFGRECVLDFLFPGKPPPPQAAAFYKQAKRSHAHLPDDLFPLVVRYFWGGGP